VADEDRGIWKAAIPFVLIAIVALGVWFLADSVFPSHRFPEPLAWGIGAIFAAYILAGFHERQDRTLKNTEEIKERIAAIEKRIAREMK